MLQTVINALFLERQLSFQRAYTLIREKWSGMISPKLHSNHCQRKRKADKKLQY